ncbi:MAG: ATP synthase F1 subunit delta [Gemmatimonadota bacterium]|nr:ATP synthase F1 subunit delta [Gemmatimonadota bacterium]
MSSSAVSRNYAGALFELAERDGNVELFGELIAVIGGLYAADSGFSRFLNAPSITRAAKKETVRAALGDGAPELFVRFLMIVLERRRHRALPGIADDYHRQLDIQAGRVRPTVTLPHEPDEGLKASIVAALEKKFDREMIPEFRTDPAILGGVIVRAGDKLLDASVRRGLKDLQRELT